MNKCSRWEKKLGVSQREDGEASWGRGQSGVEDWVVNAHKVDVVVLGERKWSQRGAFQAEDGESTKQGITLYMLAGDEL